MLKEFTKIGILITLIMLMIGCGSKEPQEAPALESKSEVRALDTIPVATPALPVEIDEQPAFLRDSLAIVHDQTTQQKLDDRLQGIWSTQYHAYTEELVRISALPGISIFELTDALNAFIDPDYNPGVILSLVSHDTAYVELKDATLLTQGMGTQGAWSFLGETTFTLTSVKGIKFVTYTFEEGDHAQPGTYSRESFLDLLVPYPS